MDYEEFRRRLGQRITALRLEKGIKQELLAELIDKSKELVSFLERGLRSPSFETLIDLANALDVSVSSLLDFESDKQKGNSPILVSVPADSLPDAVEDPVKPIEQRKSDIERLQEGLEGVRSLQRLANEYDITDIFQDNGGKVLQLLILLGLKQSKGREGNDAVDEEGNEYELKTINLSLNPNAGITTHHHLTK